MGYACVTDIPFAVELFYSRVELSNKDIAKLFGIKSSSAVYRLKKAALKRAEEMGVPNRFRATVNTEAAYSAWGLDICDFERRLKKLNAMKAAGGGGRI